MSTSGTLAIRLPIWAEPLRLLTYDPLISIMVSYKKKLKTVYILIMHDVHERIHYHQVNLHPFHISQDQKGPYQICTNI